MIKIIQNARSSPISFKNTFKSFSDHSVINADDSKLPFFGQGYTINIFLVRHAESIGNLDKTVLQSKADHSIPLSSEGHKQARLTGEKIREIFQSDDFKDTKVTGNNRHRRLWVSPYIRARETANHIQEVVGDLITDRREHILLGEQQFGLFEGLSLSELQNTYPKEYSHFTKCIEAEGRFWARPPLGESRFDVAKRAHQADARMHGIYDIVIVSHGVTLRALTMMWLHKSVDWFEREANPNYCSIRLIKNNVDKGYIFDGFKGEDSRTLQINY